MATAGLGASRIQSRSFGGCDTCRARHVKCDEGLPTCAMCAVSGIACGGYAKSLFFDLQSSNTGGNARFRRTVLTEAERESMSRTLTDSIPPDSALKWILQLEDECQDIPESQGIAISRGPFGVFRSQKDVPTFDNNLSLIQDITANIVPPAESSEDAVCLDVLYDDPTSTIEPNIEQIVLDVPHTTSVFHIPEPWSQMSNDNGLEEIPQENIVMGLRGTIADQISLQPYLNPQFSSFTGSRETFAVESLISLLGAQNTAPSDATFLLKHYSTNVLNYYTPFRDAKTPWHILVVPQAKQCLASLSIGETPDHASLCTFYGVLAVSALSLGNILGSVAWMKDKAKLYKEKAHEHCQYMLMRAYDTPKSAKYKSILMALVIMIQLSLAIGNRDGCECYFLEAEKFIRLKGLNRRKSRKVRMLHHCYAYERIIWETTSICDPDSSHRLHVRAAVEASGLDVHSQDSPTFRLPRWQDVEREIFAIRSLEEGENDLLSEQLGILFATLYPEIFGVPEPFVLIISLIVRLGREKDAAEMRTTPDPISLADFLHWAKLIEKGIAKLSHLDPGVETIGMDHRVVDQHQLNRVLTALRSAIAIYFYRRIYDHEAPRLQQKIELVRDALYRDGTECSTNSFGTAQLIWSAFIAGCEVEDLQMQASFSMWFEESGKRSGLLFFNDAVQRLYRVWKIKRSLNGRCIKWVDLMKQAEGDIMG